MPWCESEEAAHLDEMNAAAAELDELGPADLASDMSAQIEAANRMLAQQLPDGGITTPQPHVGRPVGRGQPGLEAFAKAACGFSIWDYEK